MGSMLVPSVGSRAVCVCVCVRTHFLTDKEEGRMERSDGLTRRK
jgi:hypothetical protein